MFLTPAMKAALRKMTPDQIAAALQDVDQPRSTKKQERTAHGKIQKKDLVLVAVTKAIRPLNSWIAYRSYYSTIFLSFQQKQISSFLTILWQNDPFKAKWSILAKSYSVIRDSQGKANAPLEKFLAINGPLIGVIEPARYLEALSWEVAVDEDGQTVMRRNGDAIDEQLFITNISVNDVIRNSYDEGYFIGDLSKVLLANNEAAMTMAASVQPTSNTQGSTTAYLKNHEADFAATANIKGSSKEKERVPMIIVIDDDESDSTMATNVNEAGGEESMAEDNDIVPGNSTTVATEKALPTGETSAVMTATVTSPVFDPHNVGPGALLDIDADMTVIQSRNNSSANDPDVSSLSASAFHLDGEYPFNGEFDPDFSGSTFNPFMGNQFNAFDVSDASWDDFIDFDASA
ncbi:MAG: hypothetical protein Q9175_000472 [Cornicularia normoerica]